MNPDDVAFKQLPLLLRGYAAIQFYGIKFELKSWHDAIESIRDHFSPKKPAHVIFQDIFQLKQKSGQPTDVFISKKRAVSFNL